MSKQGCNRKGEYGLKDLNPYEEYAKSRDAQLGQWIKEQREHKERLENLQKAMSTEIILVRAPWYKRLWWWLCGIDTTERIKIKTSLTREH